MTHHLFSVTSRPSSVLVSGLVSLALTGCLFEDGPGEELESATVAACLPEELDNFIRDDDVEREFSKSGPPGIKQAVDVVGFGPLDVTFGEEIDGVITAPRPTVIAFFDSGEEAERLDEEADERRGNTLLFFGSDPTPMQREALDACLGGPS